MQQSYHKVPNTAKVRHQIPTIPGGSYLIPPIALILVWAAYRQSKLDWLALRAWLALWEIKCWREANTNSRHLPHYNASNITTALRCPNVTAKRLGTALSALQDLNLVNFTPSTIWMAASLEDIQDPELRQLAKQMFSQVGHGNLTRGLRMPRRMLVFLMTSKRPRPVYAGVMFALLIRTMLTKRYNVYKGCCTASWIALVFGGDPSSIKSARARLIADGWFARLDTPQRVRQHHGEWVILVIDQPVENCVQAELPPPLETSETEPPLRNQSLSGEIETNQSPECGASRSNWEDIQPLDLHSPERREQLYHAALAAGVIRPTEEHRHTFYAAIAHATRVANTNTCGLLRRLVETPAYRGFISQDDDDRACSWLHAQLPRNSLNNLSEGPSNQNLNDRQIVHYLHSRLQKAGFPTRNCFTLIMSTHEGRTKLDGWTQARWDKAAASRREQGELAHLGQIRPTCPN